jgi:ATP-binding cassette subfamily B protein
VLKPLTLIGRFKRYYALGGVALILTNLCDTALPLILKVAIDNIVLADGEYSLWVIAAVYFGVVLTLGFFRYLWRRYFLGASHRIANELRSRLFAHLERLSPRYFQTQRTGDIMSRATNDLEAIRFFFAIGLLLTLDTVMYLLIIPPAMISLSPQLSLMTLLPLLVIPFFVVRVGRLVHARFKKVQDRFGDMATSVEESVGGIRVVKGFADEPARSKRFLGLNREYVSENMKLQLAQGLFQPTITLIMALILVTALVKGGQMVIAGTLTLGSYVAFQQYLMKLGWPARAMGFTVNVYQRGVASMGRIDEVLSQVPEIADDERTDVAAKVDSGALRFDRLTFRYPTPPPTAAVKESDSRDGASEAEPGVDADAGAEPNEREPALLDFDLDVPAGQTIALVGPVGAGKSTVLKLLVRLFDADDGAIAVDDRPVRDYPLQALRGAMGYVPQETFLFADTIRNNLAFGVPEADLDQVEESARRAHIFDEIQTIPGGMEALLGERGVNLSGGQRQRIAIARAIITKPKVLLLDDCLSAVDTETEAAILEGLKLERAGRTTIIASHRLAAVRDADQIVVLDAGRIVERGRHEELVSGGGLYQTLWERQQLEQQVEAAA